MSTRLRRPLKILVLCLVCVVSLSGCPQLLCEFGVTDLCEETYTVTYSANGADSGMVPVDGAEYLEGDTVSVQGNTGGLSLSGYRFAGWNTAANGAGTSYSSGGVLRMGAANIALYAEWSEGEEDEVEEEGATYTVTYRDDGADSGSPPTDDNAYTEGESVPVLDEGSLERDGYTHGGWHPLYGTPYSGIGHFHHDHDDYSDSFPMPNADVRMIPVWWAR